MSLFLQKTQYAARANVTRFRLKMCQSNTELGLAVGQWFLISFDSLPFLEFLKMKLPTNKKLCDLKTHTATPATGQYKDINMQ